MKYETPKLSILELHSLDVIRTSPQDDLFPEDDYTGEELTRGSGYNWTK